MFPMVDAGTYQFNGTITIGPSPASILFIGASSGSGTISPHTPIPVLKQVPTTSNPNPGDLFVVDDNPGGSANIGGILFRDLEIGYAEGLTSGAAIHVQGGGQNVRIVHVVFVNCPQGVWFENTLQCSMLECTIYNAFNVGTALTIGGAGGGAGIETYVAACTFITSQNKGVGIKVNSAEHLRVMNTRIEGFEQGILITPSADVKKLYFSNVSCYTESTNTSVGAAVLIQPTGGHFVSQVWFAQCEFTPTLNGTSYQGGGVVIDPINGSGGGGVIDQIRFCDCYVCQWKGPGVYILGGSNEGNIEFQGGYYSLNGAMPLSPQPSAGIAISGSTFASAGIRIIGVACNNSIYFYPQPNQQPVWLPSTQQYGISIGSGATNVFVRDCDLRGNLTKALTVGTSVTNVQVTDCAGYNDQNTPLNGGHAPTSATSAETSSTPYYGPSTVTFSNASGLTVHISGTAYTMSFGSIYLPNPTDKIYFSLAPTTFTWLGK